MPFKLNNSLITQCKQRDRKAIQELYFLMYGGFMRICSPYVKDETEAKTVVNDAFIKILAKLENVRDLQAFQAWANVIVKNTAIDHLRKSSNYKSHIRLEEFDENQVEISASVLHDLDGEDLLKMIQALPANERLVFTLFFVEEQSHKEISKQLEITTEMSRWLLYKARKSFKKIYYSTNSISIQLQ